MYLIKGQRIESMQEMIEGILIVVLKVFFDTNVVLKVKTNDFVSYFMCNFLVIFL
jgi:hypothetical protein